MFFFLVIRYLLEYHPRDGLLNFLLFKSPPVPHFSPHWRWWGHYIDRHIMIPLIVGGGKGGGGEGEREREGGEC